MTLLRTVNHKNLTEQDRAILFHRGQSLDEIMPVVRTIMDGVRDGGDSALHDYTERFDGARLERFDVTPAEFAEARDSVPVTVRRALEASIAAVRAFHEGQVPAERPVETAPGVRVWREWRSIERVGLYIPGGRGAYPSSVVMLGVPAAIAGCPEIVLCTPPHSDGSIPSATLLAAELVGIRRVFKLGGAHAIAAMTHGTQTVPRVHKLFGAGNAWVTAAKLLAFPTCAIDAPAGPSELLIIADDTAEPSWIAADLLSDVEHGPDSSAVLITTSSDLAGRVTREMGLQIETLPRAEIARSALGRWGLIVVVETVDDAIDLANDYAAEHLEIVTQSPRAVLSRIRHAGSIFLGPYAPNAAGDYATGTNHVLPTAQYARTFSPVSLDSFGRMIQCQEVTKDGLASLCNTVGTLAREESLEGHARAVEIRVAGETTSPLGSVHV